MYFVKAIFVLNYVMHMDDVCPGAFDARDLLVKFGDDKPSIVDAHGTQHLQLGRLVNVVTKYKVLLETEKGLL